MIHLLILYKPTWCRSSFIQSMDGQLKKIRIYTPYMKKHIGNCDSEKRGAWNHWRVRVGNFCHAKIWWKLMLSTPSQQSYFNGWLVVHVDGFLYLSRKQKNYTPQPWTAFVRTRRPLQTWRSIIFEVPKIPWTAGNSLKIAGSLLKTLTKVDTWKTVGNQWKTTCHEVQCPSTIQRVPTSKKTRKKTTLGVSFSLVGKPISNILLSNNKKEKTL